MAFFPALILLCVFLAVCFFVSHREKPVSAPRITGELLGEKLSLIQELVTVEYHYTNMGKSEDQMEFYGWEIPFTTRRFILSYEGRIYAGVDLGQAQVQVDEAARQVTVTLPESRILAHEILEDSIEVFDETKNLFHPNTITDFTDFTREQKETVEQKAIGQGLLSAAAEKARTTVETFLTLLPGMEGYELMVKESAGRDMN